MFNKVNKSLGIIIFGAIIWISPIISHAQYYSYVGNYSYTPLNITTTTATNITDGSAVLNGLVNGSSLYNTYNIETWFQYGTSANFEYSTVHNNSNSGYADYAATIGGLNPNTVYYFRAVGQNSQGVTYGSTNSFRTNFTAAAYSDNSSVSTSPSITTNSATSVGSRSAKLNSVIKNVPENSTTWFEWGVSPELGNTTSIISMGTLSSAKHINTITGLNPGTTYYFRAVMQSGNSVESGATLSFRTSNAAASAVTVAAESSANSSTAPEENTSASADSESDIQSTDSLLGASAVSAGFLPNSILGWIILVILILVLILMGKHFHRSLRGDKKENTGEHA